MMVLAAALAPFTLCTPLHIYKCLLCARRFPARMAADIRSLHRAETVFQLHVNLNACPPRL